MYIVIYIYIYNIAFIYITIASFEGDPAQVNPRRRKPAWSAPDRPPARPTAQLNQ